MDSVEGLVDVEVVEAAVVVEGATAVDVMSDPEVVVAVVVVDSPRLPGTEVVVEVEAALEVAVVDLAVDTAVVPEVVVVVVPVGGRLHRVCLDGCRGYGHHSMDGPASHLIRLGSWLCLQENPTKHTYLTAPTLLAFRLST